MIKNVLNVHYVLLSLLSLFGCNNEPKSESKPNVIILLTDDQGYGDLSCHGNPDLKTPHLDNMYKESVRLTDFHVAPVCTPTRSQLLTGMDAVRNGACGVGGGKTNIFHSYEDTLGHKSEIHLMSDFFKANGYATGHFGKWHLGDNYSYRSMDRGFDETLTFPGASIWQSPNYWNSDCFDDVHYRNGKEEETEGYFTDVYFDETIKFIEKSVEKDEPFFVYLPTGAMHTPQFAPEKYCRPYKHLPPLTAQFYGMVANFDENVGRLDASLSKLGIKENTIVIYLSDNGGTLGCDYYNAGMKGTKGSLYEGGHRVSCFFQYPELINGGTDINDLTLVQDILPTLIDLCELKMPWAQSFDGSSLKKSLLGQNQDLSQRISVVQYVKKHKLDMFTVMKNKWRLVNGTELYNVAEDIGQKNNLIQDHPKVAEELKTYYKNWKKAVKPSELKRTTIKVGHPDYEPVELSCFDWTDELVKGKGNPSQMMDIRQGMDMHGPWNIEVITDGEYEFTFRRWPKIIKAPMQSGLPPYFSEFSKQMGVTENPDYNGKHQIWKTLCLHGVYPEGKALPIKKALFSIDNFKKELSVSSGDEQVVIKKKMKKGIYKLQLNFTDEAGKILCGAYYGEIKRIDK